MKAVTARLILVTAVAAVLVLMGGCGTLPKKEECIVPPLRTYEDVIKKEGPSILEVNDSLEGFNRSMYRFNYYFDEYLMLPVVHTYEFILPDYVEDRISNAINNINEFGNLTNNLLQLKFKAVGITLSRFTINSTMGIAGLWDPAGSWGLARQTEDFGQTLAHYGVGNGSYLVLPFLGPSNVRDAVGFGVDTTTFSFVGPLAWADNTAASIAFTGVWAIDKRRRVPFRYRETGSPFEYELLRMLYTMKRDYEIKK